MHSLEVGGLERVVLELVRRARAEGLDHRLLICDRPYSPAGADFDPGDIPCDFIQRGSGLDLRFVRRLKSYWAESGVGIVHAHNDTPIAYAALAGLPRRARTPTLVGTFHTLPSHGGRPARMLTRWATGRASAMTAVSEELGARLRDSGWSRPMQVIQNGVPLDTFSPRRSGDAARSWRSRFAVPTESLLIGCLARFTQGKRQVDLIEAASILRSRGVPCTVLLAGQGPDRNELSALVRDRKDVHLLDPVEDVVDLLRELDVFVLCSDHEAHPRSVLEAMACGIPCVLTDTGGMPDMVRSPGDVQPALLVPVASPNDLADALAKLAASPGLRSEMAAAARRRSEAFSFERQWDQYRQLWAEVSRTDDG